MYSKAIMMTFFSDVTLVEHVCHDEAGITYCGLFPEPVLLKASLPCEEFGYSVLRCLDESGMSVKCEAILSRQVGQMERRYHQTGKKTSRQFFGDSIGVFLREEEMEIALYSYVPTPKKTAHECRKSGWRIRVSRTLVTPESMGILVYGFVDNVRGDPR